MVQAHEERCTDVRWHPQALMPDASGESRGPQELSFATASADSTAKLWNMSGECLHTCSGHTGRLARLAFHPMGATLHCSLLVTSSGGYFQSMVPFPNLFVGYTTLRRRAHYWCANWHMPGSGGAGRPMTDGRRMTPTPCLPNCLECVGTLHMCVLSSQRPPAVQGMPWQHAALMARGGYGM